MQSEKQERACQRVTKPKPTEMERKEWDKG